LILTPQPQHQHQVKHNDTTSFYCIPRLTAKDHRPAWQPQPVVHRLNNPESLPSPFLGPTLLLSGPGREAGYRWRPSPTTHTDPAA